MKQNNNNNSISLNAAGIYVAMSLAAKHNLPIGKVIELLNDFINVDGYYINFPTEVC